MDARDAMGFHFTSAANVNHRSLAPSVNRHQSNNGMEMKLLLLLVVVVVKMGLEEEKDEKKIRNGGMRVGGEGRSGRGEWKLERKSEET